jgi:D-beta-D-heptose 7-phosphate kinase / D-beta-D-heptose 1-phosphate adenosyltransferase
MTMHNVNLLNLVDKFTGTKVLVIGEAIVYSIIRGSANRLDLEAPVPVVEISKAIELSGGAANCAVCAARLGASVQFLSVVGNDSEGDRLIQLAQREGIGTRGVIFAADRQTLLKRKIYADDQLIVRYDQGSRSPISGQSEELIIQELLRSWREVDLVILSDYGQGLFTRKILDVIAQIQKQNPRALVADTRRVEAYQNIELSALCTSGFNMGSNLGDQDWKKDLLSDPVRNKLSNSCNGRRTIALTSEQCDVMVFENKELVYKSCVSQKNLSHVNGAGDAFSSGFALSLAVGAHPVQAAEIAAAFASIIVKNAGLPVCCPEELKNNLNGDAKFFEDWQSFALQLQSIREQNKRIVFTNGVFDILHSAHIAYLNEAKSFADILVIGVNTDESVHRLKGPERPINSLIERCRVLAGLSCVDFVVPFGESNPINLIRVVKPDVYVKGGDYTRETLPEAEVVESFGGELRILPYQENHSTTSVIERIQSLKNGGKKSSHTKPNPALEEKGKNKG